jgi:hypothetical protein
MSLIFDICLPNRLAQHEFFDQIDVQQGFENLRSIKKLWIFDTANKSKQIYYGHL